MRSFNVARLQVRLQSVRTWLLSEKVHFQACLLVLITGHLLAQIPAVYDVFSLAPSSLFLLHIWRPITASLMEMNPLILIWTLLTLHQLIHIIEPVWGLPGVVKFAFITQLVSTLLISVLALAAFALFNALNFFYYSSLNGVIQLSAGTLVAVKQFLPDSVLITTSRGRLKNTHLPLTMLAVVTLLYFVGVVRGTAALQTAMGIQVSHTYLRFFQRRAISETTGDDSDHFAWATIFPRLLQPPAAVVGNTSYNLLVKLKLLRKIDATLLPTLAEPATIELDANDEAERKRGIALRELQSRLLKQQQRTSHAAQPPQRDSPPPPQVEQSIDVETPTAPI